MKTVLIPQANVSDLYDVDPVVKKAIHFVPVSDLSQVLSTALVSETVLDKRRRGGKQSRTKSAPYILPADTEPSGSIIRQ